MTPEEKLNKIAVLLEQGFTIEAGNLKSAKFNEQYNVFRLLKLNNSFVKRAAIVDEQGEVVGEQG